MLKLQYFGHLIRRANSLEKTLMLGKIEGKKRAEEDEMVGWYCRFSGQEFEQTPGDSEGEGSLVCCNPWGHKELDMTEWLNNNNNLFCSKRWSTHINLGKKNFPILVFEYWWNHLKQLWHVINSMHFCKKIQAHNTSVYLYTQRKSWKLKETLLAVHSILILSFLTNSPLILLAQKCIYLKTPFQTPLQLGAMGPSSDQ